MGVAADVAEASVFEEPPVTHIAGQLSERDWMPITVEQHVSDTESGMSLRRPPNPSRSAHAPARLDNDRSLRQRPCTNRDARPACLDPGRARSRSRRTWQSWPAPIAMAASRKSRVAMKWSKSATAAEWRLRADMGAEPPVEEDYVSPAARERMKRDREMLRAAFAALPPADRRRQADSFKRKLRPLCPSPRAHKGAWDGNFAPLLTSPASLDRPRPSRPKPPLRPPASPRSGSSRQPKPATQTVQKSQRRKDPQAAARALDIKLRVARPSSDAAITRLATQLNADRHFLIAFGGPVSERQIRSARDSRPSAGIAVEMPRSGANRTLIDRNDPCGRAHPSRLTEWGPHSADEDRPE